MKSAAKFDVPRSLSLQGRVVHLILLGTDTFLLPSFAVTAGIVTWKENRSVFVDFYADWCGPCKMLAPVVEQIAEEVKDVVFVKVNVDTTPDIASRYGIMSIPTLIAFKDGQIAGTSVGFQPKEALMSVVNQAR